MGDHPLNRAVPVALVLLLAFTLVPLNHEVLKDEAVVFSAGGHDPGVSDVPVWRVGDRWIYSGTFDPSILITDTGVDADTDADADNLGQDLDLDDLDLDDLVLDLRL